MSVYNPNTLLSNPKLDAKITAQEEHDIIEDDDLPTSTASASEMTGLTPTPAKDESESDSYKAILPQNVVPAFFPGQPVPDTTIPEKKLP